MKEIKFRAKRLYNNEWAYGFYAPIISYPIGEQTPSIKTFRGVDTKIKIETLGQYTGLSVKNLASWKMCLKNLNLHQQKI